MEEKPNVNNLNGVPNFGHGFPEDKVEEELETSEIKEYAKEKENVGKEIDDGEEEESE